ncbi:ribokinase-like [Physella acuta]|uniref:ribokinase-like n=1 Tax=Physella acuta TaxID=109671 RepID=UPI0027DBDBE6|nr:ribokinase-like [Physella acuta]
MDVVIVGSCITDFSSYVSHLPQKGETLTGHKFETGFGGKGGNQCIAAVKLGAKTAMVAKLGDDVFGKSYFENLKDNNVNCDHVQRVTGEATGIASIFVGDDGSNCIVIVPNANDLLTTDDVEKAEDLIKSAKLVVCQNEVPRETTLYALKLAQKHGVVTIFNPAPAPPKDIDPEFFTVPDIFCPNETEASTLLGMNVNSPESAQEACGQFINSKGCKSVIITLGEKGAVYQASKDDAPIHIPTVPVAAVDTTGAGDSFIGSLAFFLTNRPTLTVPEMIQRAGQIAAVSVTKTGTQKSFPKAEEVPDLVK